MRKAEAGREKAESVEEKLGLDGVLDGSRKAAYHQLAEQLVANNFEVALTRQSRVGQVAVRWQSQCRPAI